MSELTNYIELLLREDLPKEAKVRLAEMIKEAEANLRPLSVMSVQSPVQQVANLSHEVPQAASTLAAMAKHDGLKVEPTKPHEPEPVKVIAQTPATVAAMEHRNAIISGAISGNNLDRTTGRPKKW